MDSVSFQTYPNIEHIIIDGGSTDQTLSIIHQYHKKIKRIISEPDHGIYDAMNKGIKYATGDILQFLNAGDSLCDPDVITDIIKTFYKNPQYDIIYGKPVFQNVPKNLYRHANKYQLGTKSIIDWMLTPACHQGIFIRRHIFDRFGPYDTSYKISGDVEFFLRCFKCRVPMQYIDRTIVNYDYQGASLSNIKLSNQERLKAILKHATPFQFISYSIRVIMRRIKRFINKREERNHTS
jgi:glycosyltransferase involved in cell wall biosynthesis